MLNNCIIMGRLTADPELRHTNSGVACCSFTLAVERDGKPNEQTGQRAADFIDCTAWRNTAEFICKWFSKGRMAVAAGRMQTRTWKDRHDQSRKSTRLKACILRTAGRTQPQTCRLRTTICRVHGQS
jgi:single-strand DNA-binding protein